MNKYEQLLTTLEDWIDGPHIQQGDKLPSIRKLASRYACSHSTVIRALQELERRHRVYVMPKSGFYVIKRTPEQQTEQGIMDFTAAAPDPELFPYRDFQHCLNQAIDTYRSELFVYGTPRGLPALLEVIRRQLTNYQVFAQPEQIVITSGVQQALSLLAGLDFPNGKQDILIEQPGYHLLIALLVEHGMTVRGIARTANGIDMQELERIFRTESIKFFYTMPRFHNPLGVSYSEQEKKQIAALAERYDVYIVEDDYMADFERNSRADPIYAYNRSAHVIYLKSFSKIIFPGLRVGAAVLPAVLADSFTLRKRLQDIDSPMLSQAALEIYIQSGMYSRHLAHLRDAYTERAFALDQMLRGLAQCHPDKLTYIPTDQPAVMNHLTLEDSRLVDKLIPAMQQRAVNLEPITKHYLPALKPSALLKLNVTMLHPSQIREGLERLSAVLATL